VGSLIALSAMTACLLIERAGGGREAGPVAMGLSSLAAVGVCGAIGAATGVIVTLFRVPPFVVTLGVMLAASGLAGMLTGGEAAHQVPESFTWLASGTPLGLPNAILLMLAMYAAAHVLMSRTRLGRHIYAVGGNRMAAHLSGIATHRVLLFAFTLSAVTAGLAGVVMASRLKSANPTFGKSYELYVIAAVVVGGTSLSGGSGKVLGTLIGAFIIAVMQNGMNLLNGMKIVRIDDFTQDVVLGAVLLAAVVLDQVKRQGLKSWRQLP
jgi:ribose transport system permease protein